MSKWKAVQFVFMAFVAFGMLAGCNGGGDDTPELVVTSTPNPVTHTAVGASNRWDFKITLRNNSDKDITLQGYNSLISNTDTGFTDSGFNAATVGGHVIVAGTFWEYNGWRIDNRFGRAIEKRIYTGLRSDGKAVEGEVSISLQ
ncbi:MAG: hypothetical protein ACYC9Y_15300 [Candidatus Methylomirabilia bacterium]